MVYFTLYLEKHSTLECADISIDIHSYGGTELCRKSHERIFDASRSVYLALFPAQNAALFCLKEPSLCWNATVRHTMPTNSPSYFDGIGLGREYVPF